MCTGTQVGTHGLGYTYMHAHQHTCVHMYADGLCIACTYIDLHCHARAHVRAFMLGLQLRDAPLGLEFLHAPQPHPARICTVSGTRKYMQRLAATLKRRQSTLPNSWSSWTDGDGARDSARGEPARQAPAQFSLCPHLTSLTRRVDTHSHTHTVAHTRTHINPQT